MEVANASMHDGATSCAEAALMARRVTKRGDVVRPARCIRTPWQPPDAAEIPRGGNKRLPPIPQEMRMSRHILATTRLA